MECKENVFIRIKYQTTNHTKNQLLTLFTPKNPVSKKKKYL